MSGRKTRVGLTFVATMAVATMAAGEPRTIGFDDLPDPAARDFEDPFRDMGTENLVDLKTVVRLRERLALRDIEPNSRARLETLLVGANSALAENGYDADTLIQQRWDVARHRRTAARATNPELEGAAVTMSGYLIPAPASQDATQTHGYLVAAVGLCSHLPVPPPNQLVRVSISPGQLPEATIYEPLTVTGTLDAEASDEVVFVLDGEVRMSSSWALIADEVRRHEAGSAGNAGQFGFTSVSPVVPPGIAANAMIKDPLNQ